MPPIGGTEPSTKARARALDPMRVLQLGKYYYPFMGGIETHLYDLCVALSRSQNVEAVVCNTAPRTVREVVDGVSVTRVATLGRAASTEICPTLPLELSRRSYDVVHLHTPNPMGMLAYWLAEKPSRHALIVTHHSDVVRQAGLRQSFEPIFRRVMARADAIIATSRRYLDTSKELRAFREKCVVIPYGLRTECDQKAYPLTAGLRARYGDRVVLAVGRLIYYKGFDVLIEAMSVVRGSLLIVGDGPLRSTLSQRVQALGLQERVTLVGEVHNQELGAYLAAADVFAFPSVARSEAFGIAQLEAMAAGLPVVNTALDSGVPDVSIDGETGITVAPSDSHALANALELLLSSPALRRRYGDAGRHRVQTRFSWAHMSARIAGLYRDVLDRRERAVEVV